tara:strand:+ start:1116 stop:2045 length:930 start_codon:yes stop_codon:yes gene_type:complete
MKNNILKMRSVAVTGARGLIGKVIVKNLLNIGCEVKVLTRSDYKKFSPKITIIKSDINNEAGLRSLLDGVDAIFHCAAELKDTQKMYSTNVEGTHKLINLAAKTKASFFCHLSSAGVIGATDVSNITEETTCNPKNLYEKTKFESERLVANSNLDMSICILRPTNVFSSANLGSILSLPINNSWKDIIKVHMKGRENAHLVYAKDVANVALFFLFNNVPNVNIYFVSYDDDINNTVAGIYNLYQSLSHKNNLIKFTLPNYIPYLLRKTFRRGGLNGGVKFSSDKLKKEGFTFEYGVRSSLEEIYRIRGK